MFDSEDRGHEALMTQKSSSMNEDVRWVASSSEFGQVAMAFPVRGGLRSSSLGALTHDSTNDDGCCVGIACCLRERRREDVQRRVLQWLSLRLGDQPVRS